jgi:hypothetical protein
MSFSRNWCGIGPYHRATSHWSLYYNARANRESKFLAQVTEPQVFVNTLQELVAEGAERQRVADCGVGRAGSPSRPVAGWQPGSRRAARRSAPTTSLQSRTRNPEFFGQVTEP